MTRTVSCIGLLLRCARVGGAPDDVAAVGVRAHELRAVAVPRQTLQLLQHTHGNEFNNTVNTIATLRQHLATS